ncbi:MAG: FAD-dependent oxidoreductase [Anaerorhabdus sp.]
MKKLVRILMALVIVLSLVACSTSSGKYTSGVVEEVVQGHNGDLKIAVTFSAEEITAIEVVETMETVGIGDEAIEELIPLILSQQNTEVDTITGATVTSEALIKGVQQAIDKASGTASISDGFTAGVYTATSTGFHGDVTVEVVMSDTAVESITVTEHNETRFVSDNAINNLPQDIVEAQSLDVDSYTGATISSNAVKRAVRDAITQSGDVASLIGVVNEDEKSEETIETDVVVIGGGIAGLSAAITAREAGSSVVLIEKLDRVGGSTVLSGGIFYAANSSKISGLDSDTEDLYNYWYERSEGYADETLLRIAAEQSGQSADQLMAWGVVFSDTIGATGISTAMRALYTSNAEANGAVTDGVDFIKPLVEHAEEIGVTILTGVEATELLVEDGVVVGVKATSDRIDYEFKATSTVLATGGYDLNRELMVANSPSMAGSWAISSVGNTGDGLVMAETVGAQTLFYDGVIGFKIIDSTKHYTAGSNLLGWLGLLGVTNEGVRFGNESADYPIFATSMIDAYKSGAQTLYLVLDSSDEFSASLAEEAVASGLGFKAATLEELATAAGINEEALLETVEGYNQAVESQSADEYGKVSTYSITAGDFYAVEINMATLGTIGGLVLSENAEVLDNDGQAIGGLYAAGEIANAQFFYKEYPASGSSISVSTTFGIIAGKNAAINAQK